ncbi:MAG: protein translocase subunit SecF, partial [Rhodospirillales bacterium]
MTIIPFRFFPKRPNFQIINGRRLAYIFSGSAIIAALLAMILLGLNLGIDFRGGSLIETRFKSPPSISELRGKVDSLGLGEITIQEFGNPNDILIRIQKQPGAVEDQTQAIKTVTDALGSDVEIRRTEFIGPTVGEELKEAGAIAVLLSLIGIVAYVWFRFEWQFAIAGIAALVHDVVITIGLFAVTG